MPLLTKQPDRRKSGVVLVIVLGITMVMAWLAIEVLQHVRQELAIKNSPLTENQLRQTAYQLLEVSIAVLAETKQFEGELYSPSQGWAFPLIYAGIEDSENLLTALSPQTETRAIDDSNVTDDDVTSPTEDELQTPPTSGESLLDDLLTDVADSTLPTNGYTRAIAQVAPSQSQVSFSDLASLSLPEGIQARVRLYDESGKLSIKATSPERWILFFQEMGFEESESKALCDSLLDWIDADNEERENGAETLTYSQLEPPYQAPNRVLRDFQELRYLQTFKTSFFDENGQPNNAFILFKNNVSLYHNDEVNLNTASELVINTLAEEKNFDADSLLNFLAGSDMAFGTQDDAILRPGLEETDLPKDVNGEPLNYNRAIRYIRAEIAVSNGQAIYYLNSILDLSTQHPGGVYPFKIVRIIENQPLS
ncbi:type II secretion system protein GspK [Coraliomargarita sp. SDUM461004]|uniref:Type II secretion system protein GspK n=1 Tax=Thalassobacterium sedimentorum TaxID=3041258 RepID=A0ABU1AG93_9BACT|nr:type II secretion system protein GspK [Coraliomargarita sp. SDUM461004]MDQ8193702.1 type II secretion system protein GspK [Coraliomargarita sp. SDUM461004]